MALLPWSFYTEAFTTQSFQTREKRIYTLDEALSCTLSSNMQPDFGANFGVNRVTARKQLYTGFSQRF